MVRVAGLARAVQNDLVIVHRESGRHERFQVIRASLEFEYTPAVPAMEMMMVRLAGKFVSRRLAGNVDGNEIARFNEVAQVAIDRGDADTGRMGARFVERLLRTQRPARFFKDMP